MKNLSIFVFIGMCFIMKGASETIKCYECDNCDVVDERQLITCPLEVATNSPITNKPTTLVPDSTTNPSEEPTASESTGSPLEVISTTVSPKPPQIVITDPTKTQEPVTESTGSPLEEISTTVSPKPPQIVITDPTQTQEPVTESTRSPLEVISTTVLPKPPQIVITDPSQTQEAVTESTRSPLEVISTSVEAQAPSQSLKPETVNSFAPVLMVQPSQYEQPYQIFNRMPRSVRNLRSTPSYHCYSINIHDGDSKKVKKGCVEVPEEKGACDVLKDKFGKSVDKCKICTVDKCNSCSTLKYSIITLVMVLVVSFY